MRARAIMVLGTSSHVGKSLLVTALCRIFSDHGIRVAPFKSQNMSLNSAASIEGLEIGRAQALQAEAARIPPSVHMNPVLLKPSGNMTSQVIVCGKIWSTLSASDYHLRRVEELMPVIRSSYQTLAAEYDVIVLEGAGSPAEINLKQHDIVNMRMAAMSDAHCLLVGDIDRGGVFASLLGTLELLDPDEQQRIHGFVINKFRGDVTLLTPGIRMIEDRVHKPCLGVIPYQHQLRLDEEDSLGLPAIATSGWALDNSPDRPLRIAVLALPSFSNFTDFDPLLAEPSVALHFCRSATALQSADILILPGSKQTVDDLLWLRAQGLDQVLQAHAQSSLVVGICGGMQMLGRSILDPLGMERAGITPGLDLLPFTTTMQAQKVTSLTHGTLATRSLFGQSVAPSELSGYEIHIGETTYLEGARPFATIGRTAAAGRTHHDGCISHNTRILGTYLHGIFDNDGFRHLFLAAARAFHRLAPAGSTCNWKDNREASLNRLAAEVSQALDLPRIFSWVGRTYKPPVPGHDIPEEALDQITGAAEGVRP